MYLLIRAQSLLSMTCSMQRGCPSHGPARSSLWLVSYWNDPPLWRSLSICPDILAIKLDLLLALQRPSIVIVDVRLWCMNESMGSALPWELASTISIVNHFETLLVVLCSKTINNKMGAATATKSYKYAFYYVSHSYVSNNSTFSCECDCPVSGTRTKTTASCTPYEGTLFFCVEVTFLFY